MRSPSDRMLGRALVLVALVGAGCRSADSFAPWPAPTLASPALSPAVKDLTARWNGPQGASPLSDQALQQARFSLTQHLQRDAAFALAELHYAAGTKATAAGSANCVDLFYQAAGFAYYSLFGPGQATGADQAPQRMREVYNSSLVHLIEDGQTYGRLDPKKQLVVQTPDGTVAIPLIAPAGPWRADDIDQLVVVGDYAPQNFQKRYGQTGLGIALVALRRQRGDGTLRDQLLFDQHPFALTVVLRPDLESLTGKQAVIPASFRYPGGPRLELYDPAQTTALTIGDKKADLAGDMSAPLQYRADTSRLLRLDLLGFRQPGAGDKTAGLFFLEPYQRGKIPVVFVHGLLSDPNTWDEMLNELRADPDLSARFQFAVYMYPTGNPFLLSASNLRQKLRLIQELNDPKNPDPALGEVVLIGHSMGGVLSRFQVTRSDNRVWDLVAKRPFDQLVAPPDVRQVLHDAFYFEPQPFIKRVVFIGTPHRGSTLARNVVGRLGACLVTPPPEIVKTRDLLLTENPGAFNLAFARHMPSSVEDLAAGSPILDVMQKLPFSPGVHLHSIIGAGKLFPLFQPGDGCVPITSAHLDNAESELLVDADHTSVHRDPRTVGEVKRILGMHAAGLSAGPLNQ